MTPEVPSDPEVREVALAKGALAYTDEGSGPVVVAVHGLPGSVRDFRWLGAALAGRVRLIRLDLPGFGATPSRTEPSLRLEPRGAVVREALDALDLRGVVILGHSYGGPVATAAAASPRVAALGLLASVGVSPHRGIRTIGRWGPLAGAVLAVPGLRRALVPTLRKGYTQRGFPRSTPDDVLVRTFRAVLATSIAGHRANVARLRVPTLVAWTEDDPLVEVEISTALANVVPPGPRISFPDGGHNLQKTRAVELADSLAAWASQVARS